VQRVCRFAIHRLVGNCSLAAHFMFVGVSMVHLTVDHCCVARVASATDTSNFDPYPDSPREAPDPVFSGRDPFAEF
jgi:hypothetical protein